MKRSFLLLLFFLVSRIAFTQVYSPIGTSGYNLDAVAENTPVTSTTGGPIDGSNYVLYSAAYGALYSVTSGLPNSGLITTGTRTYQLQSYTVNNVLYQITATSGTITLNTPGAYAGISILGFATEGNVPFDVTLKFTDNSTATYPNQSFTDWFGTGSAIISGFDRVSRATGTPANATGNPKMFALDLSLSCANRVKNLQEIAFQNTGTGPRIVVMAISGAAAPSFSANATFVTCVGGTNGTASISATGGILPYTYTWSTVPVQNTAQALNLPAGAVTYSAQDNGGCVVTGSVTVTQSLIAEPSLTLSSNIYTVCSGNTFTMGVVGASTYTWGSGSNNPIYSPPPISTTTQTQVTYTVTGTSSYNCPRTGSLTITVNPRPAASFSGTISPLCNNSPVLVLAPLVQQTGGSFSGTGVTSGTFFPSNAGVGTFTITYTRVDANNCSNTATASVQVFSLAAPQISTVAPLCSNSGAVQLTVSPTGGTFGGNGIGSSGTFSASVAGAGTHNITYTITSGPCTSSANRNILVNAAPTASFVSPKTFFCKNSNSIFYNANPSGGTFIGPGMNGPAFNPSQATIGTNTITYLYTDGNGCSSTAIITVTVSTCAGINEAANHPSLFTVFPNPSSGKITLAADYDVDIIITSELGQRIVTEKISNGSSINIDLSAGIYFVTAHNGNSTTVSKIVITK
jgi:hypothetical protein